MRGHDVEEFVGVVRRYGADAAGSVSWSQRRTRGRRLPKAKISRACGTCLRLVKG
jgi:hypothetical protein